MTNEKLPPESIEAHSQEAQAAEWRQHQAELDRREIAESKRIFEESEAYSVRLREEAKKTGGAERTFAEAAEFARNQIKSDGLDGQVRPHHVIRYTVTQGIRAAVHGREDGIATLVLQKAILTRLDAIKSLMWVALALLAFIAYKVA